MAHISEGGDAAGARNALAGAHVTDPGGREAEIVSVEPPEGAQEAHAWVRLDDGAQLQVPVNLLERQADGAYRLPFSFEQASAELPAQMTFPVIEETLQVSKRLVDTGRGVRIHKTVSEQEKVLDEPLLREQLVVEHVPIGRVVEQSDPPQMRYQGDTLVVPVLEEVLVVQKQLFLKEEVHITRQRRHEPDPRAVRLRTEQVTVERFDEKGQA